MKQKTIGILGIGWLGTALATELLDNGHIVKGTVRSKDKMNELQECGIDTYYLEITEDKIYGDLAGFMKDLDTLYINIPPGLRKNPESDFTYRMKLLMTFVREKSIPQIIFVSSTAVFEDLESIPTYTENDAPNATTNNGIKIAEAEKVVLEFAKHAVILRSCGLIGADRHPIKMLSGKTGVKNPDAPINLVSREHVINLSIAIINGEIKPPIVHAVSEPHESRKSYYERFAKERGIAAPEFDTKGKSVGKKIVSDFD